MKASILESIVEAFETEIQVPIIDEESRKHNQKILKRGILKAKMRQLGLDKQLPNHAFSIKHNKSKIILKGISQ
jgi:hypothetical protein